MIRAQDGLALIKQAIVAELAAHPYCLSNAEIVSRLDLESDFEGQNRNYLSWSILGLLIGEGKVSYSGKRQSKRCHVCAP